MGPQGSLKLGQIGVLKPMWRGYFKILTVDPGRSQTHDLPHGSPVLNQLSHWCAVNCLILHHAKEEKRSSGSNHIVQVISHNGRNSLDKFFAAVVVQVSLSLVETILH